MAPADPSLELLNFSTGVNSKPESVSGVALLMITTFNGKIKPGINMRTFWFVIQTGSNFHFFADQTMQYDNSL